jgi:hypothetical protein
MFCAIVQLCVATDRKTGARSGIVLVKGILARADSGRLSTKGLRGADTQRSQ